MVKIRSGPWCICLVCAMASYLSVGTISTSFSVQLPYLQEMLELSNTQTSLIISVRVMAQIVSLCLCIVLLQKMQLRWMIVLGLSLGATGFIAFSVASGYGICLVAAALIGLGYGLAGTSVLSAMTRNWFDEHRALVIGLITAASGVASMVNPKLIAYLMAVCGVKGNFNFFGLLFVIVAILSAFLLRDNPEGIVHQPSGGRAALPRASFSFGLKCYIALFLYIFFQSAFIYTGWAHLPQLYTENGWSAQNVASIISMGGLALAVGKVIAGELTDRFSFSTTCKWFIGCGCISSLISCFGAGIESFMLQAVNMVLCGLAGMLGSVGLSVLALDFSDDETYKTVSTVFSLINCVGGMVFSAIVGVVSDAVGGYRMCYGAFFVLLLVGYAMLKYAYKEVKTIGS